MYPNYAPMIDPLGAAPRIALILVFAITALVTLIRLAPFASQRPSPVGARSSGVRRSVGRSARNLHSRNRRFIRYARNGDAGGVAACEPRPVAN